MWETYDFAKIVSITLCVIGIIRAYKTRNIQYVPLIIWLALSVAFYASTFMIQWSKEYANLAGVGLRIWGYTMILFMIRSRDG